ncbi:MAG: hypothetical protein HYY76_17495 [Acidobacteria bacterium]|nr:hypothetical protein [Acidobacteriota bacterium]
MEPYEGGNYNGGTHDKQEDQSGLIAPKQRLKALPERRRRWGSQRQGKSERESKPRNGNLQRQYQEESRKAGKAE